MRLPSNASQRANGLIPRLPTKDNESGITLPPPSDLVKRFVAYMEHGLLRSEDIEGIKAHLEPPFDVRSHL